MFLIRLFLRLVLLFFLFITVTEAWHQKDWVTRSVLIFTSVLLVAGIYMLRYLRSMEKSNYATGSHPSMAWQLMWSQKTPFFPKGSRSPLLFEESRLAPFFPLMSPGFHIVCARLVPMAIGLSSIWIISRVVVRHWDWWARLIQQISGLKQSEMPPYLLMLGMLLYIMLYMLVQRLFMRRVPARCMVEGCDGPAFLSAQAEQPSAWRRRAYQYVYTCSAHNHRQATGVLSLGP